MALEILRTGVGLIRPLSFFIGRKASVAIIGGYSLSSTTLSRLVIGGFVFIALSAAHLLYKSTQVNISVKPAPLRVQATLRIGNILCVTTGSHLTDEELDNA